MTCWAIRLLCMGLIVLGASDAWAGRYSSGGYSRPSYSSPSSRTPSSGGWFGARTPSTSGGYSRPSAPAPSAPLFGGSTTDRSLSRQASQQALDAYQTQQRRAERSVYTTPPPTAPAERTPSYRPPSTDRLRSLSLPSVRRSSTAAPTAGRDHFGPWSALMLWQLLDSLSKPGHAEFFHHHQDDPGYRDWRAEAEARAVNDAPLRAKLNDLDTRLQDWREVPRDPNYLPPDAAQLNQAPAESSGGLWLLLIVCLLVIYLAWRRLGGDIAQESPKKMFGFTKRAPYRPQWFRLGMTLPVDPSLFILAAPYSAIQAPQAATASGLITVESLGELHCDNLAWRRLYVSGERSFFQVHLDAAGQPDECRYFSLLDEVTPASQDEWGFWLDPHEGMLGWPEFQTRDGRLYTRSWAPGAARITPRVFDERLESRNGQRNQRQQAMLYARSTGASAPAPEVEYLLISVFEQDGAAWVTLHVGVDVSVSALQLS